VNALAIDWEKIKKKYEAGLSVKALAKTHGVKEGALESRVAKDGWSQATAKSAFKGVAKSIRLVSAEKSAEDITEANRRLWSGVKKRLVRGLKSSDLKSGLEELKLAKMAGEALTSVIKGELEAWKFEDSRDNSVGDAEAIIREMASLTASLPPDEVVDGE
jgi:hypothetical protein